MSARSVTAPVPVSVEPSPVDEVVIIIVGEERIGLPLEEGLVMAQKLGDAVQTLLDRRKRNTQ